MDELIDIVDESWEPTGEIVSKYKAHSEGILHRVVHIHFYDMHGNMYFQKRSSTKNHFPWMLHFAVGGHVWVGESLIEAIHREWKEELWIMFDEHILHLIGVFHQKTNHPKYALIDNEIAFDYWFCFDWNIEHLIFEDWEVEWIEKIHIVDLIKMSLKDYEINNIVPYDFYPQIFKWILTKLHKK